MSAKIDRIIEGSIAQEYGIREGDILVSINDRPINDSFDYDFMSSDPEMEVVIARNGREKRIIIENDYEEDLGVVFDKFLMDGERYCCNKCIFCFIDQMPKGLRDSLYFKDDDERLSFLFGNYITLTNMNDDEIERIIEMNISPINISVHATEPEIRNLLMVNPHSGEKLRYLYRLAEEGITINCQIVLCRDYNDGEHLRKTIEDLAGLWPSVRSISVVPAGLTDFREKLPKIRSYDKESSIEVLELIERKNSEYRKKYGCGIVYAADEFYLMAGKRTHNPCYYDGMPQIDNGVGMLAKFRAEFNSELLRHKECPEGRKVTVITGEAAYKLISHLSDRINEKFGRQICRVMTIKNEFFGGNVWVSGLITGTDIMKQINAEELNSDFILLPRNMLRTEGDLTLDGYSVDDIEQFFGKPVFYPDGGREMVRAILN